ncbi:biogenesis of lysosome-related organelles complex 1 subunit 5 [Zophobas morio]|uniref:biogenesis of lysosome-related organelles complex 1 subunit 5 n=1 Tax=Zophobas morio TaxID=2755281 RepID=UPI003083D06E
MILKMSDICKDIGNIWSRQFDHRSFLSGEINSMLQEFEQKRKDTEVDNLFKTIENITDIKDTEVDRFKQAVDQVLPETNNELQQALTVCSRFSDVENKYKESDYLERARQQRKTDWDNFMDYITTSYSEINSLTESKEEGLQKVYSELAQKLKI